MGYSVNKGVLWSLRPEEYSTSSNWFQQLWWQGHHRQGSPALSTDQIALWTLAMIKALLIQVQQPTNLVVSKDWDWETARDSCHFSWGMELTTQVGTDWFHWPELIMITTRTTVSDNKPHWLLTIISTSHSESKISWNPPVPALSAQSGASGCEIFWGQPSALQVKMYKDKRLTFLVLIYSGSARNSHRVTQNLSSLAVSGMYA